MFNPFLSSLKPGLKLKSPSLPGWGFWFNTKLRLFIVMLCVVGVTTIYLSKNVLNCEPFNNSTAWTPWIEAKCLQKLLMTNAGQEIREEQVLKISNLAIALSLAIQIVVSIGIWWIWRWIDRGHFEFLLNGSDVELEATNNDQPPPPPAFTWITENNRPTRKKSFIGSFLAHHRTMTVAYVITYLKLEVLIFALALAGMFLDNWLMNGHFIPIGQHVFEYIVLKHGKQNPLLPIFGLDFNCDLSEFGEHFGPDYHNACVLNLNWLNEAIVVCLWIVRILLLTVSSYRLCFWTIMAVPGFRRFQLRRKWSKNIETALVKDVLVLTGFCEHILLDAIFRHTDVDKFNNVLLQIRDDIPAASPDMEMSLHRRRLANRIFS